MTRVALPPAKILHVAGWGKATPTGGQYVIDFEDAPVGGVVIAHARNGKMAYRFLPVFLSITIRNESIQTGGGFIGGGFGLEGAALGMLEGAVLNALTTRNRHYGMVTFASVQEGMTPRTVVLGFENLPDHEIRARVVEKLGPYMESWVTEWIPTLEAAPEGPELDTTYHAAELMLRRQLLTPQQFKRLEPAFRRSGHVEDPAIGSGDPDGATSSGQDVVARIQELVAMHASGALTDDEFAAAKAKLLG